MGAGVNIRTIISKGGRALLLGLIACLVAGGVSLVLTLALA